MSQLLYRTIADERPQGKPNVYFSCYPGDLGKYFDEYALKILRIQDCAVWYESRPDEEYDLEDLQLRLSQMQLFVMPVTSELLTKPNRAMDEEFELAQEKHIPVLPLMMEQGLDDVYRKRFGDLQYLDPNNTEDTKRSFDEMLAAYIKATLVNNELATKVRAAFDAYIFLSYRKKDRKKAQELMQLIHKNPLCRDIAIWYDEFLTPGEDFNQAIGDMLEKSDLFALAVTPNLVNEINYVMTTEYPAALAKNKPVLPVEMVDTDRSALEEHYEDLPPCVRGEDGEEFRNTLLEKLKAIAVTANDEDPQHNYLIGLAYLDGIDV
ncbi:MAG: toll/interleukin-1 receptor domain-containing protein, partial [Firmicutes bacterium]|nr:toll/interleukin-1 receptor domain-containing protein [Bacillota bacterium]